MHWRRFAATCLITGFLAAGLSFLVGMTPACAGASASAVSEQGAAVTTAAASAVAASAAAASAAVDSSGNDYRRALELSQAAIGRSIGEHTLRDTSGKTVRLSDYRGQPRLVSFIYTGCFQICPTATQFLALAVKAARDALGQDSFKVVSIGFNQPFDDPVAMRAFARQAGIDDSRWAFLSPDVGGVQALTADFGFSYEASPSGFDHVLQVSIVDANGRVYRQVYGDSFEMPMLVQPLKELLSGQAREAPMLAGMWQKVKLYCTVYDPNTGGYRVDYSLFVEIFAGLTMLGALVWFGVRELRRGRRVAAARAGPGR
ncbi:MAG TPA: SCO family protein [Burkholderiaceae bacterium]|nr:SCO family protein [Burkholderiaceae bacterium]